ncbi:hypothetical protein, partial [Nostoc edaphicum]|uniref:hypothetical protein n=1 Tax=Nostoc edaphicum TaxID=264686 RepID=UPI001D13CBDF
MSYYLPVLDFRFWILRKVCSKIPQGAPTSASPLAQRKAYGIAYLRDASLLKSRGKLRATEERHFSRQSITGKSHNQWMKILIPLF